MGGTEQYEICERLAVNPDLSARGVEVEVALEANELARIAPCKPAPKLSAGHAVEDIALQGGGQVLVTDRVIQAEPTVAVGPGDEDVIA